MASTMTRDSIASATSGDSLDFKSFSDDNETSRIPATDESSEGEGGDECVRDEVVNGAESVAVSDKDEKNLRNTFTVKSVNDVASTNGVATIISEKSHDDQKKNGNDLVHESDEEAEIDEEQEKKDHVEEATKEDVDGEVDDHDEEHEKVEEDLEVQKDSSVEEMKNDDINEDEGDQLEKVDSRKLAKGTKKKGPGRKRKVVEEKVKSVDVKPKKLKVDKKVPVPVVASTSDKADAIGDIDTGLAEQVKSDTFRRERKQVERFTAEPFKTREEKSNVIASGKGTKLGDIEHILNGINNTKKSAELSDLHRLCFGRQGTAHEIKRNIRQFSGYLFDEDSKEFVSKRTSVTKWTVPIINGLAGILGIKRRETKEYTIDAILKFCLNPDEAFMDKVGITSSRNSNSKSGKAKKMKRSPKGKTGRQPMKKGIKRKSSADGSDEEVSESEASPNKKKRVMSKRPPRQAAAGKRYKEAAVEMEEETSLSESEAEEKILAVKKKKVVKHDSEEVSDDEKKIDKESDLEQVSEEDEKTKKKPMSTKKKDTKVANEKSVKNTATKSKSNAKDAKEKGKTSKASKPSFTAPKKVVEKDASDSEKDVSSDEDSSKKKPMTKPKTADKSDSTSGSETDYESDDMPTDSELEAAVKETVSTSNLKKVTMKMMIDKVCSKFPNVNLEPKKQYIKGLVKNLL